MNILTIGHSWVVSNYRKTLRHLAGLPSVNLTALMPDYWEECSTLMRAQVEAADCYRVMIRRPVSHRQHLHFYPGVSGVLREVKPDIVYLLEEPMSVVTATVLKAMRRTCPQAKGVFYTFLNDDRDLRRMPGIRRFVFPWAMETTFRLASGALCASSDAEHQMRVRGFSKPTWKVPFGLSVKEAGEVDSRKVASIRKRIAPGNEFVVGIVGRVVRAKGIDLLLRGVAGLRQNGRVAKVVVVGDGEERQALSELAAELGIAERVHWTGTVPNDKVMAYMAAFDVLTVPSRRDGNWVEQFGRVIVEGKAARVPVIGSSSGEIPNVVGETGFVFKENDHEDLRQKLQQVYELPSDQRQSLVERAYAEAVAKFDHASVAQQYIACFEQVLEFRHAHRLRT